MPVISGGVSNGPLGYVLSEECVFTETTGAGVYTGSVVVPANSWLLDIKLYNTVYWTATTSALMDVGDVADPDGWYTQINMKATDIVAGTDAEVIDFNNLGGKAGAYIVAATGERALMYAATERIISGIITTIGAAGNAGRSRMVVMYTTTVQSTEATKV